MSKVKSKMVVMAFKDYSQEQVSQLVDALKEAYDKPNFEQITLFLSKCRFDKIFEDDRFVIFNVVQIHD